MSKDYQSREDRMRPFQRQYPWWIVFVVGLIAVYALAQCITDWGASSPLVDFVVRSCGV